MSAVLLSGEAGAAADGEVRERKAVAAEADGKASYGAYLRYVPGLVIRPGGDGRED